MKYDWSTAEAVCNDATKDTWEVQARGDDGQMWTVSDSSQMSRDEAEREAKQSKAASLIELIEAADLTCPEQVADLVLDKLQRRGYTAAVKQLERCKENEAAELKRIGIE